MRNSGLLVSALHVFFLLLMGVVGCFLVVLFYTESLREVLATLILVNPAFLLVLGGLLLFLSFLLGWGFYLFYKNSYLIVKSHPFTYLVDGILISQALTKHWEEKFPDKIIAFEAALTPQQKLQVLLHLAGPAPMDLKTFLKQAEKEISFVLVQHFAYCKPFEMLLSS